MKSNLNRHPKNEQRVVDDKRLRITLSSADLVSHDDILTEILLRLPVRSLIRSKCVSKHWEYLISSSRFALLRNPNPSSPCGLFLRRNINVTTPEYDFVPFDLETPVKPPFKTLNFDADVSHSGVVVLQSSSGLMLCHNMCESMDKDNYYIYNPTINQFTTLPELDVADCFQRRPCNMTLAFDPLKSPHYKVICVRGYLGDRFFCHIEIYSSETGSWEASGIRFRSEIDLEFMGGVYWNDAVHWIICKRFVLYLKINRNQIDQILTPTGRDIWDAKRHCCPLVESRDSLLFIDVFPSFFIMFDVYKMDTDYSGWSKKYSVDNSFVGSLFPDECYLRLIKSFVVHCLVLEEREQDAFLVLEMCGKFIRYNLVLQTFQKLCDFVSPVPSDEFSEVEWVEWPGAFLFIESLSPVC